MGRYYFVFAILFVFYFGRSQSCLPNGITFTSQYQIDQFPTNYPGCSNILGSVTIDRQTITNLNGLSQITSIGGDLYIQRANISNLNGLNNLTSIGGNFQLQYYQNVLNWLPNLNSLSALSNLQSVGGSIIIGLVPQLLNLNGLQGITSLPGNLTLAYSSINSLSDLSNLSSVNSINISGCSSLSNLNGLENLTFNTFYLWGSGIMSLAALSFPSSFPGSITIGGSSLNNLNDLSYITSVAGSLNIQFNNFSNLNGLSNLISVGSISIVNDYGLTNLQGLENLENVTGDFSIYQNQALTSLEGITSNILIGNKLNFYNNPQLSSCAIDRVCDYLNNNPSKLNISNNKPDCNNAAQVTAECNNLPPACTGLSSPYPGETEVLVTTNISWSDATNLPGAGYYISIGSSPGATDILTNTDVGDVLTYDPVSNLPYNTTIYVKISPYNVNGTNTACTEQSFTTGDPCPTYIYLTTQNEVNNFPINYPDCQNAIYIEIGGTDIVNLSPLNQITSFSDALYIYETGLSNLNAFPNLTSTVNSGLYIYSNSLLSSITGFNNLNTVGFLYIEGNPLLTNCEAEGICNILEITPEIVYINANATGCNTNEEVIEACGIILPVDFLSFEASKSDSKVFLNWQTTSEKSLSSFSIQRSSDAIDWEDKVKVEAKNEAEGVQSYSLIDNQPLKGTNYYRLRINDQNGNFEYSPVRSVYFGEGRDNDFEAYGSDKTITLINNNRSNIHYFVYNSIGRIVADTYDTKIPVPQSGIYLVSDGISTKKVFVR